MNKKFLTNVCGSLLLAACSLSANASPILWVGDSSGRLGTVDAATGDVTVIGNMGVEMTDIAFDPAGNLFGITFGSLFRIDKTNAQRTLIGNLGTSLNSLVFDTSGTLYAANTALYTVNTSNGSATRVGNGGVSYASSGDLAFIGDELFLSATGGDRLVKLDTATGAAALVGNIGFSSVFGLASPNATDLYGLAGTNVLSIDPLSGLGTVIANYSGQGLGVANGSAFASESVVPVPGAVWLFATGFLTFIGVRKSALNK